MENNTRKKWVYTGKGNRRRSITPKVQMSSFYLSADLNEKALPLIKEQGYTQFMTDAVKLYLAVLRNEQD